MHGGTLAGSPYAGQDSYQTQSDSSPTNPHTEPEMSRIALVVAVLGLPLVALSAPAQARAHAKSESSAKSSGGETKQSSHSSSHKVVVVNGKTVVDEKIVDGKKVGRGLKLSSGKLPAGMPDLNIDDLLRRARAGGELGGLMDELKRRVQADLPKGATVHVIGSKKAGKAGTPGKLRTVEIARTDGLKSRAEIEKLLRSTRTLKGSKELRQKIKRLLEERDRKGSKIPASKIPASKVPASKMPASKMPALSDKDVSPATELDQLRKKVDAAAKQPKGTKKGSGSRKLSRRSSLR